VSGWTGARSEALTGTVLAAAGLTVGTPTAPAAAPVDRSHEHIVHTFNGDRCGIAVITAVDTIANSMTRLTADGSPITHSRVCDGAFFSSSRNCRGGRTLCLAGRRGKLAASLGSERRRYGC
jgi:hypothetical protein